jgi:hypothetical protein
MKEILAVAVVLIAALTAQADTTTGFVLLGQGAVADGGPMFNIHEMRVTTSGDWTNSRLDLVLTAGSIGHNAFGSNYAPDPNLIVVFPELANDTYVATPDDLPDPRAPSTPGTAGPVVMTATEIHMSWYDLQGTGALDGARIAQITLSTDAWGTLTGASYGIGVGWGEHFEYTIINGRIVPEPAVGSLLLLGGLSFLHRRRR